MDSHIQPGEKQFEQTACEVAADHSMHNVAERGQVATDMCGSRLKFHFARSEKLKPIIRYGQALLKFDAGAEKRLRRKIDLYVVPTVALPYLFCFIDRANIGNARLAGLEMDLGMNPKSYDYNIVLSVFYVGYILFEFPSIMACKVIGPGYYIPAITLGFGVCSLGTAFVTNRAAICGVRFLLGVFEAGMLPGIAYYLSRWYRRDELAFRLSLYIVMSPLAGAFGGLLASGILKLDSVGSLETWRMIFVIEGIITCALSMVAFLILTDRPATARWLEESEKQLAISRIKSERVGTTEVLDRLDMAKTLRGIFNPVTLTTAFIFLLNNITVSGLAFFEPTIIKTIYPHNSVVSQQLHTVAPYVLGAVFCLAMPYLASRFNARTIFIISCAPLTMAGYVMFLASTDPHVRHGASFLIAAGAFALGPLTNAHVSANVVSDTARSAAIGTNVMFGNLGGLISTWSYLPNDGPNYHIGNGLNLATTSLILLTSSIMLMWMTSNNKRRAESDVNAQLQGKSQKQIQDLDWKHASFRWHR